jgi:hypothetical protein
MKNITLKQIIFIAGAGFFLTACGGGSSNDTPVAVKVPACGTAADLGKSVAIDVTGKTIKKVGIGAKVRIWHSSDENKSVCMIRGEAEII